MRAPEVGPESGKWGAEDADGLSIFHLIPHDVPYVAFDVGPSHLAHEAHVLPYLVDVLFFGIAELEVDDDGLVLANHDAVGAFAVQLAFVVAP